MDQKIEVLNIQDTDHCKFIQGLDEDKIVEVSGDIDELVAAYQEQNKDVQYWLDILKYFEVVFEKRKQTQALDDIEDKQTVDDMLEGKDLEELNDFMVEIEESIAEAE